MKLSRLSLVICFLSCASLKSMEELNNIIESSKETVNMRQAPRAAVTYNILKKINHSPNNPQSTQGTIIVYNERHFSLQHPPAQMQIKNLLNEEK